MLFGPKQRVHSGRIPDHCDRPKIQRSFDYVQTMYSEQSFAIERGCHSLSSLGSQLFLCAHCPKNEVETELHFLTSCQMYDQIRDTYFTQITQTHKELDTKSNFDNVPYLLGEIPRCAITAARCAPCYHKKRATGESEEQTQL